MKIIFWFVKVLILITLPFILLIRGAIYWHERMTILPQVALIGGLALTFVVLLLYLSFFFGRTSRSIGIHAGMKTRMWIAAILLGGYALYGLFYVSSSNTKSNEVRKEYRSLHPILRLSLSTLIFIDPGLMITDANRVPEDYGRWGLPVNNKSLHYRQSSGYVHAVDLRTRGRGALRNNLVKAYFRLMGFNVLQHGGTADHLHISLMSHDSPWSK